MASDMPGPEAGPQQPEPEAQQPAPTPPAEPAVPGWTAPPPPNTSAGGPIPGWGAAPAAPQQPPQPQAPAWGAAPQSPVPGWGAAPQQPAAPQPQAPAQWGAAAPKAETPRPQAPTQWGAAAPQRADTQPPADAQSLEDTQPQAPAWGSAAPEQSAPQSAPQPTWSSTPPQPAPQPAPQPSPQPSPQPGWGATAQEPPQQQPSQQQAPPWSSPAQPPVPQPGWAAPPPPQGPAPQPGWGTPGQPQPGYVYGAPPPAKTGGNGCLKACLIVGAILVVLAIVVVIALGALGASFFGGLGIDSSGNLKDCPIVSSAQLKSALGPDTEAHPLSGLANAAVGLTLDKRVLKDADNCYIVSGASGDSTQVSGGYGRIAKYSGGDAASVFDRERSSAQAGKYFAQDVSGAGDQAFCTGWSDTYPATGALVRRGNDLVYVSLLVGSSYGDIFLDQASSAAGVPYSPKACSEAVSIAELAFH